LAAGFHLYTERGAAMPIKFDLLAAAWLVLLTAAVVGAFAFMVGPAFATHVSCGDAIVEDTTLDSDLSCPNNGIVIGADDITLDLNGHTIDGDGTPFAGCRPRREFCDIGVLNDGHDGVTVRDGSVREFLTGVFVGKARQNRVLNVSSSRNQFFGFVIAESTRSVVRGSSGNRNPGPDGDGIAVFGSRHVRILGNSFRRNELGMHVEASSDILIKGNVFSRNSGPGILMEADRNQVRRNRFVRNPSAIIVAPGNRNVIVRNRITRGGEGVAIEKGRGNLVAHNVIVRARRAGIRLGVEKPPIGGVNTVVRRNLVSGSGGDGYLVARSDRRSLLRGNIARGAGDDGFDVESRSTKLTGNRAVRNADLGIEAVPGVIDGGGNRAGGNGNPLQCTNVFCT
jgi:parallel beta-helix repeat protein